MIGITTKDGRLYICGDLPIPSAEAGQWPAWRIAKLLDVITQTVEAAEIVDGACNRVKTTHPPEIAHPKPLPDSRKSL